MRVLILHSRYLSGPASGENRVAEDETRLLREGGHEVHLWDPTPAVAGARRVKAAADAIWSHSAVTEVRRLIRETGAEIVHCHNLFPTFSPAVLRAAADQGAAVVMTLHNYRLMCLPSNFLRNGLPCEDCLGRAPWPGVVHRCYRNSALASGVLACSLVLHRNLHTFEAVRRFLAVSRYVRQKHIDAGVAADRIAVKPNFAWGTQRRDGPGEYFVYLGRLSPEKGLARLIEIWQSLSARLVVVGSGPQEAELRSMAPPQVEFRGLVAPTELGPILTGARALVLPSMWYEAQPRSILEAYAAGVPVITNRIGGMSEVVVEEETGLLVEPGDARGWEDAVRRLSDDHEACRLGEAAYGRWKERFSPERGLELLENAYRQALDDSPSNGAREGARASPPEPWSTNVKDS